MKRQSVAGVVMFILLFQINIFAQQKIDPYPLDVTVTKTINIIFPYAIKSVDRGSKDLLVQKANGVENILQVKAAMAGIQETNLTVVTADGSLYSYQVRYSSQPPLLNIRMEANLNHPDAVFEPDATTAVIKDCSLRVQNKRSIFKVQKSSYAIQLLLKGIYTDNGILYFQLGLVNNSWLDYPISRLRLFVKDRKTSKRTASQEIEIQPLFTQGSNKVIYHKSAQNIVIAVPAFTIPDKKVLRLQMQEANGGRHLQLNIKNRHIIKAWRVL